MKTILVAEDREASRELARTFLEHSGYFVLEAVDGGDALRVARAEQPDLILLDLQMPVKNGFEVLHELRADERFRSTPIVALTASAMISKAVRRSLKASAQTPSSGAVTTRANPGSDRIRPIWAPESP